MTSATVRSNVELEDALANIGFPEHAAIVRCPGSSYIEKSLRNHLAVLELVAAAWDAGDVPIIESDMRARFNPTRMSVIAQACGNAVERARSRCPACRAPGYWQDKKLPGLRCAQCELPTGLARARVWACHKCRYENEVAVGGFAKAGQCDRCNP